MLKLIGYWGFEFLTECTVQFVHSDVVYRAKVSAFPVEAEKVAEVLLNGLISY